MAGADSRVMELDMQQEVVVEEVCVVKPSKATSVPHLLYLNSVDRLLVFSRPIRSILFYPAADAMDVALSAFASLHHGLAETLIPYYPFAGRFTRDSKTGQAYIDCNDAGVELIFARCSSVPFSEVASHSFLPRPFYRQLAPMDHLSQSGHTDAPLASLQLTAFSDGIALGFSFQHSAADGLSAWMFIQALSETCRKQPISVVPLHMRTLLTLDATQLNKMPPKETDDPKLSKGLDRPKPTNLMQGVVHFSKEAIDKLKEECGRSAPSTFPTQSRFSSYQALSAYLWKRFTMAKELESWEPVHILHYVDMRTRTVPPLTIGYCGNAIVARFTVGKAGELMQESLGTTADSIRRTIQGADNYSFTKFIHELETPNVLASLMSVNNVFMVRNASYFPVYEAGDFGWGKPAAARSHLSDGDGDLVTWYPGQQPGSLDVLFAATESTCANFFSPGLYPDDPLDILQLPRHVEAWD